MGLFDNISKTVGDWFSNREKSEYSSDSNLTPAMEIRQEAAPDVTPALNIQQQESPQESVEGILENAGIKKIDPLVQPQTDTQKSSEQEFRKDYAKYAQKYKMNPDPYDPKHFYDYKALWQDEGEISPDESGHLPSQYKEPGHPRYYTGRESLEMAQKAVPIGRNTTQALQEDIKNQQDLKQQEDDFWFKQYVKEPISELGERIKGFRPGYEKAKVSESALGQERKEMEKQQQEFSQEKEKFNLDQLGEEGKKLKEDKKDIRQRRNILKNWQDKSKDLEGQLTAYRDTNNVKGYNKTLEDIKNFQSKFQQRAKRLRKDTQNYNQRVKELAPRFNKAQKFTEEYRNFAESKKRLLDKLQEEPLKGYETYGEEIFNKATSGFVAKPLNWVVNKTGLLEKNQVGADLETFATAGRPPRVDISTPEWAEEGWGKTKLTAGAVGTNFIISTLTALNSFGRMFSEVGDQGLGLATKGLSKITPEQIDKALEEFDKKHKGLEKSAEGFKKRNERFKLVAETLTNMADYKDETQGISNWYELGAGVEQGALSLAEAGTISYLTGGSNLLGASALGFQESANVYPKLREKGLSPLASGGVWLGEAATLSALEKWSIDKLFSSNEGIGGMFKGAIRGMYREPTQESAQEFVQNSVAKTLYDEDRGLFDNTLDVALSTVPVGFFGGMFDIDSKQSMEEQVIQEIESKTSLNRKEAQQALDELNEIVDQGKKLALASYGQLKALDQTEQQPSKEKNQFKKNIEQYAYKKAREADSFEEFKDKLGKGIFDEAGTKELFGDMEDFYEDAKTVQEGAQQPFDSDTLSIPAEASGQYQQAQDNNITDGQIAQEANEIWGIQQELERSGSVETEGEYTQQQALEQAIDNLLDKLAIEQNERQNKQKYEIERQQALEEADSFENAFQSQSQVGETVYHGTDAATIYEFNKTEPQSGYSIGRFSDVESSEGFYFTSNQNQAEEIGENVVEAKVNITNPLIKEGEEFFNSQGTTRIEAIEEMRAKNKDGIIFREPNTGVEWYFVPFKEQISTRQYFDTFKRNRQEAYKAKQQTEAFEGFEDVTTKVLQKLSDQNVKTASKETYWNLAKNNVKKEEQRIIREVLDEYSDDADIPAQEFADKVKAKLLPITKRLTDSYNTYGLENIGRANMDREATVGGSKATTHLWNTTYKHGLTGHFNGDFHNIQESGVRVEKIPRAEEETGIEYWAVIDNTVEELTRENIQEHVYHTAHSKEAAQEWIENQVNKAGASPQSGLLGHTRMFIENKSTPNAVQRAGDKIYYISEVQSDTFNNQDELFEQLQYTEEAIEAAEYRINDIQEAVDGYADLADVAGEMHDAAVTFEHALRDDDRVEFEEVSRRQFKQKASRIYFDKGITVREVFQDYQDYFWADFLLTEENFKREVTDEGRTVTWDFTDEGWAVLEEEFDFSKEAFDKALAVKEEERNVQQHYQEFKENLFLFKGLRQTVVEDNVESRTNKITTLDTIKRKFKRVEADAYQRSENKESRIKKEKENLEEIKQKVEDKPAPEEYNREKQFVNFRDRWYEPLVQKEIKEAANRNADKFRMPTAHTVALVEKYIDAGALGARQYQIVEGDAEEGLKEGDIIRENGEEYQVMKVTENELRVAPTEKVKTYTAREIAREQKSESLDWLIRGKKGVESVLIKTDAVDKGWEIEDIRDLKKAVREGNEVRGEEGITLHRDTRQFLDLFKDYTNLFENENLDEDTEMKTKEDLDEYFWEEIENWLTEQVQQDPYSYLPDSLFYKETDRHYVTAKTEYTEIRQQPDPLKEDISHRPEEFDIDEDVTKHNAERHKGILHFYENAILTYFKKMRKGRVRKVTDDEGVTWWETELNTKDKVNPVPMYHYDGNNASRPRFNMSKEQMEQEAQQFFPEEHLNFFFSNTVRTEAGIAVAGEYVNNMIRIQTREGKVQDEIFYHESFHHYIRAYNSIEQQNDIMRAAAEKWGFDISTDEGAMKAEEALADGFAEWMRKGKSGSYGERILRFFRLLYARIKSWAGLRDDIVKHYDNIVRGEMPAEWQGERKEEEIKKIPPRILRKVYGIEPGSQAAKEAIHRPESDRITKGRKMFKAIDQDKRTPYYHEIALNEKKLEQKFLDNQEAIEEELTEIGSELFAATKKKSAYLEQHDWLPKNLRSSKQARWFLDYLDSAEDLVYFPGENQAKRRGFLNAVWNRIDSKVGIDTLQERHDLLHAYENIYQNGLERLEDAKTEAERGEINVDELFGEEETETEQEQPTQQTKTKEVSEELQPLAEEAKKYDSAEEFENSILREGKGDKSRSFDDVKKIREEFGTLQEYDKRTQAEWFGQYTDYATPVPEEGETFTIYRGVPEDAPDFILPGDYISQSREYAENHARGEEQHRGAGEWKVIEGKATLDDLAAVNPNEFWYAPKEVTQFDNLQDFYNQVTEEAPEELPTEQKQPTTQKGMFGEEEESESREQDRLGMTARDGIFEESTNGEPKTGEEYIQERVNQIHQDRKGQKQIPQRKEPNYKTLYFSTNSKTADTIKGEGLRYGDHLHEDQEKAKKAAKNQAQGTDQEPEVIKIDLPETRISQTDQDGVYQFQGKPDSNNGNRYPEQVYDAYNQITGKELEPEQIDQMEVEHVEKIISQLENLDEFFSDKELNNTAPEERTAHALVRDPSTSMTGSRQGMRLIRKLREAKQKEPNIEDITEIPPTESRDEDGNLFEPANVDISPNLESAPGETDLSEHREALAESLGLDKEELAKLLEARKRGEIPHEQTKKSAEEIDKELSELIDKDPRDIDDAETVVQYVQKLQTLSRKVNEMRKNMMAEDMVTPEEKEKYNDMMDKLMEGTVNLMAMKTEAGRTIEAAKMDVGILPGRDINVMQVSKRINNMREELSPDEQVKFDEQLEDINFAEQPQEVFRILAKFQDSSWMEKVVEYYKAVLLSAPITHIRNTVGNTLFSLFEIPVKFGGGVIDWARAKITGSERTAYPQEALKATYGGFKGISEGVSEALKSIRDEYYGYTTARLTQERGHRLPAIGGVTGKVVRIPYRFLGAMDVMMRTVNRSMEINALAYRRARQKGLEGNDLIEKAEELKNNPTAEMMELASKMAKRRLFLENLDGFVRDLEQQKNKRNWTHFVTPFFKTPSNLLREGYRMTPFRLLGKAVGRQDQWLENDDTRMEEYARISYGSMIAGLIIMKILDGTISITGRAPRDPDERDRFYQSGKQPYSIRIGDKWYEYRELHPFSTVVFLAGQTAASINLARKRDEMKSDQFLDRADQLITSTALYVQNLTFMQGLSNFVTAVSGGSYNQGIGEGLIGNYFQQLLGGFIPNIIYSYRRAAEPTIYSSDSFVGDMKKRIPGLASDLPKRKSALGKTIKRPGNFWSRMLNPITVTEEKESIIYDELKRMDIAIGFPQRRAFGQPLKNEEYTTYLGLAGRMARNKLIKLIQRSTYKQATDYKKQEMISDVVRATRRKAKYTLFKKEKTISDLKGKFKAAGYSPKRAKEKAEQRVKMLEQTGEISF